MNKTSKQNLMHYQSEEIRALEEEFAIMFSEKSDVRVFFINENSAFTDGINIILDPSINDVFCDFEALRATENFLKVSHRTSLNEVLALAMITRGQNIHECLHLLYTNFPGPYIRNELTSIFQRKLVSLISNIIEDSYIENYAATRFDQAWHYLRFLRVATTFSKIKPEGTVSKTFQEDKKKENAWLMEFLEYTIIKYVYPFFKCGKPASLFEEQYEKTKSLFEQAIVCPIPDQRDEYAYQIYELLKPFLTEEEELHEEELFVILNGYHSHMEQPSIVSMNRKGRIGADKVDNTELSPSVMENILNEMEVAITTLIVVGEKSESFVIDWKKLHSNELHKGIIVHENHVSYDIRHKKAYENICEKNQYLIQNLSGRLRKQLKERYEDEIDRQLFGRSMNSRRFTDVKKRYWKKAEQKEKQMELRVVILVDGSLSMAGIRQQDTLETMIVMHEVFEKNKIKHCIVEHKAIYGEPLVEINIMVDFDHKVHDKYALMQYHPDENTRDGIVLNWTESYLKKHVDDEHALILVISDGFPIHNCEPLSYVPPQSIEDSHQGFLRLKKHGVVVVGIALGDCYEQLKSIYDNSIDCYDSTQLSKQLFRVIQRELKYME